MRHLLIRGIQLACASLPAADLVAQGLPATPTIEAGTAMRLGLTTGIVERGRLAAPFAPGAAGIIYCRFPSAVCPPTDTSLVLRRQVAELSRLEVRTGNALKGALVGGGVVLAIIVAGRAAFHDSDAPAPLTTGRVYGMIVAVGLGAFAGSQVASRWEQVPIAASREDGH